MLKQELLNTEAIFRILLQALINEILEGGAPALVNFGHGLVHDRIKQVTTLLDVGEGRGSSSELIGEAAKGPHIDLLRVLDALCDLGADPVGRAALRLPIRLLLR